MNNLSRRDVVKLAAGVVAGASACTSAAAAEGDFFDFATAKPADPNAVDAALISAIDNPYIQMFGEQVEVKLEGDRYSRELVITSARDKNQKPTKHYVRSGTIQIFRADADVDEFTKSGGLYWSFNGKQGKVQFKNPGQIVMVVRDHNDNARFYTLHPDLRC
jgi:hypothetical protein